MKTKAVLIAIVSAVVAASSFGQPLPTKTESAALTIIIDTSWSCDRYMGDFRSLARQAAAALGPGNIEILVARASSPTLKLATTIKTGSAEEIKSIDAVLATVRAQFLSTASVASALEVTFARLNEVSSKRGTASVTTIIFTNGQMGGDEAKRVLAIADRFQEKGWSLYLTCDRKTANRDILLAANKGKLACSIIAEANPAIFLEKKKAEGPAAKAKEEQATEPKPKPPEPETKPSEQPSVPPSQEPQTQEKQQKPLSGQPQAQTPQGPGYHITVGSTVEVAPLTQLPSSEMASPPQGPRLEANEPQVPVVEQPAAEPPPEEVEVPQRSFWVWLKKVLYSYGWLALPAAVVAVAVILTSTSMAKASKWDKKVKGHLAASASSDSGVLVMRYGDQSYQLGPLNRFRSVHIGPGSKNAIKTPDIAAGERLIELYRHNRRGVMLKNLASLSIMANGIEVKPRRKHHLILPAVIEIKDTKLNLELVRHNISPAQTGRSSNYERQAEPQRVG